MKRLSMGAAALLLGTACAMPAVAETTLCTQITAIPYTISAPGVYCLEKDFDVALSSGAAIQINASDVTLDLNRHLLSNLAAGPSVYVYGITASQQKNVVIKNGAIEGFFIAIAIFDSSPYTATQGNVIRDIAAERNAYLAFDIMGQGNLLVHNLISQTAGPYSTAIGMLVIGPNNVVRDNDVIATGPASGVGYGIYGYTANGLIVEGNRVSGISSSAATASFGILILGSSHTVVRDNAVDKADTSGAGYYLSSGINLSSSPDGAVVGNQVAAFYYGLYSSGSTAPTNGNVVIGATVPTAGTSTVSTY